MGAPIIDIADAVTAALNAPGEPGFSQPFTAARKFCRPSTWPT